MKRLFLLLLVVVQGVSLIGEEPPSIGAAPRAAASQIQPFKIWWVPPATFTGVGGKPLASDDDRAWDLRDWFARQGVLLAPSEGAWYDRPGTALLVQAQPATLDLIDQLGFQGWTNPLTFNLRVEAAFVEFSATNLPAMAGNLPLATLRRAAGRSWHVIHRIAILGQSGQRTVSESTILASTAKRAPTPVAASTTAASGTELPALPVELGPSLEIEPIALQEDNLIAINLAYGYRVPGASAWDWKATLSAQVQDGVPILLQMDSDPVRPNQRRALILRVDIVYLRHPVIHPLHRSHSHASQSPVPETPSLHRSTTPLLPPA